MAKSLNSVTLVGNLGRDPEIRVVGADYKLCTASLAVSRSFKKKGSDEWTEKTSWIEIKLWGEEAQRFVEVARKGHSVMVQGYLEIEEWEDKRIKDSDGEYIKRSKAVVVVDHWMSKPPKGRGADSGGAGSEDSPKHGRWGKDGDKLDGIGDMPW
jgi:single-strand DNA-binding protein